MMNATSVIARVAGLLSILKNAPNIAVIALDVRNVFAIGVLQEN